MATRQSLTKVFSCIQEGMSGVISEIEVSLSPGLPTFDIIGLCDSSIRESRGRIKAALISSGFYMPKGHITVGISPAYMRKSGSSFDLPIALGILFVSNQIKYPYGKRIYAEGELSLTGDIKSSPGSSVRLTTIANKFDIAIASIEDRNSACCAGFNGMLVKSLSDLCQVFINDDYSPQKYEIENSLYIEEEELDFSLLKGQEKAKRALLIAASGLHSLMVLGSSGCGKTLAGSLISSILPPMSKSEISDVYMTQELCGINNDINCIRRPYRRIHPNMTVSQLMGNNRLEPGELMLANHGVMFADEICEFKREFIESLRLPLEEHVVRKQKDGKVFSFPASFIFIAAGNPCKCGNFYETIKKCNCSEAERKRYISRLSGPFLDRMDLFSEMRSLSSKELSQIGLKNQEGLNTQYKEIVSRAWDIQRNRFKEFGDCCFNGTANLLDIDLLRAKKEVLEYASELSSRENQSGRGYSRIIRVARTIADMEGRLDINKTDIMEALTYRIRVNI